MLSSSINGFQNQIKTEKFIFIVDMSGFIVWLLVILCVVHSLSRDKPRLSLDETQSTFNVGKHRKYEDRSKKLRKQTNKLHATQRKINNLNTELGRSGTRFCNNSLSAPHFFLSNYRSATGLAAIPVSSPERSGNAKCSFLGAVCSTENMEHTLVSRYIQANDSVLEIGARYGTTSCEIASILRNSGQLISVEPDYRVWNILDENRILHHCNFWLLRGVISNHSMNSISGNFYSTRSSTSSSISIPLVNSNISINQSDKKELKQQYSRNGYHCIHTIMNAKNHNSNVQLKESKQYYTIEEIQYTTNMTLTVLLIDCEGCIDSLFYTTTTSSSSISTTTNSICNIIKNIKTIILEADMPIGAPDCAYDCVDYSQWIKIFSSCGLAVVYKSQDPVFPKIYHYVFKR